MPPIVWRVETGACLDPDSSAADVVRYEQDRLGRSLGIAPALLLDLERRPAWTVLWVWFTRESALLHGDGDQIKPLRLDLRAYVIATDDAGGFLLFFPDDTRAGGGAIIDDIIPNKPLRINPSLRKSDKYIETDSAARQRAERDTPTGGAAMADRFEDDPAAKVRALPTSAEDDEEQKRRAGRSGGGDMGNPADANLGANIRPDIGSGPGGLETFTTQKSEDYRANPDAEDASEFLRGLLAEAARNANPPTLTLEAITNDPWNAVELPLPANADKELLLTARDSAQRFADIPMPDDEHDAGPWHLAEMRVAEVADRLGGPDPVAQQQENDASTKRQDAERAARSGEESPTYGYAAEIAQGILAARGHEPEPTGAFAGVHYRLEQDIAALGLKPTAPREVDPYTVEDWLGEDRQDSAWGESPYDSAARRDAEVGGHQAKPATNVPNEPEYRPHGPDYLAYADLQNPWNAVAMPLHPDSDPLLREGALYAACYCALGEHQLLRATRSGEYSPPLYDPDTAGHAKHEGIEASASWAEMAVEKMLIYNYRDIETLRSTESHFADIAESRGVNLDNPQYEVLNYRAEAVGDLAERLEERAAALALIDERTLDPVRQQENDASTKRQEAERAARSGDNSSSDAEASGSDFIKTLLSEAEAAKAERGSEGAELVMHDHGEGKTPGGGRGIF